MQLLCTRTKPETCTEGERQTAFGDVSVFIDEKMFYKYKQVIINYGNC